jgi:hypothetical protein
MKRTILKLINIDRNQQAPEGQRNFFNSTQVFVRLAQEKRIQMAVIIILVITVILEPFIMLKMLNREEKAVILDPSGTYYISPIVRFEKAVEIQKNIGNLAAVCLFSVNPTGYDFEAVIEDLFIGTAKEKLISEWEENKATFAEKKLHQKAEIFSTTVVKAEANFILVKVEGQIIRAGGFESAEILHAQPFTVQFILNKNPNLIRNGKYPFTVCDFQYKFL